MGAGGKVQPGQAHRGAHHVAHEGLELAPVAGMDEDPVVHGEAASPPRQEQIDPLLANPKMRLGELLTEALTLHKKLSPEETIEP
jgi:hypothetical protein